MDHPEYIPREIAKETDKAYMVKVEVANRRDGWFTKFRWVAKKVCKPCDISGFVNVPEWIISNGKW